MDMFEKVVHLQGHRVFLHRLADHAEVAAQHRIGFVDLEGLADGLAAFGAQLVLEEAEKQPLMKLVPIIPPL